MIGGWEAKNISWNTDVQTRCKEKFPPWGQSNNGRGCSKWLCRLPPQRFWTITRIKSWATAAPALTRDFLRHLPTCISLWSCKPVHLLYGFATLLQIYIVSCWLSVYTFFLLSQRIPRLAFTQNSFCLTLKIADVSDVFLYYIDKFSYDPWLRSPS